MINALRYHAPTSNVIVIGVIAVVLLFAYFLGSQPAFRWFSVIVSGGGALLLLTQPHLGLLALVLAALVLPLEIGTGTEVTLNTVSLLVPSVTVIWFLAMVRRGHLAFTTSPANRPLLLFLMCGLASLLIGRATWDPSVPVRHSFLLVQLAQWAIFAFSGMAFWLTANLLPSEEWLWRLTALFLLVGGGVAILRLVPGLTGIIGRFTTGAFIRAPFWILLAGLAGGQLLFNGGLTPVWRGFLLAILGAVLFYAFVDQQEAASNWVGLAAVVGTLIWLRFSRLRWPLVILLFILWTIGILFPIVYEFAGGDAEWDLSGGSRLVLIQRVVEVTLRNPITGLGPAAYRPYANMQPLFYLGAYWVAPLINSHNNYVDLFAHGGLLGLLLFFWFSWEVARLGLQLHRSYTSGFPSGYVNGILAVGAGSLVLMALADWILPFVYNIGFLGFQASVLVWMFLGGLVALDHMGLPAEGDKGS